MGHVFVPHFGEPCRSFILGNVSWYVDASGAALHVTWRVLEKRASEQNTVLIRQKNASPSSLRACAARPTLLSLPFSLFTIEEEPPKRLNSPRVAYLATRMRFDPFGKLRDSIDGMTGSLEKEKADEIHHKDDCVSDFNENDKQTTERNGHNDDVEAEINTLLTEIDSLDEEEKRLMAEIADSQIEMKKASENREKENKDFQETIADQRATQAILKKAVDRLGEFYNKKAALVQQPVPGAAAPPPHPPPGFGE